MNKSEAFISKIEISSTNLINDIIYLIRHVMDLKPNSTMLIQHYFLDMKKIIFV